MAVFPPLSNSQRVQIAGAVGAASDALAARNSAVLTKQAIDAIMAIILVVVNGGLYTSTAAGLAAVADGTLFFVYTDELGVKLYLRDGADAVLQKFTPAGLDTLTQWFQRPVSDPGADTLMEFMDEAGRFTGNHLGRKTLRIGPFEALDDGDPAVLLQLNNGYGIDLAKGFAVSADASRVITTVLEETDPRYEPRQSPRSSSLPIFSDGRSLFQWKSEVANWKLSGSGRLTVIFFPDSWSMKRPIPQALKDLLVGEFGAINGGWISVTADLTGASDNFGPLDDATFTKSGWTLVDMSPDDSLPTLPAFGVAVDGQVIYTTGQSATAAWTFTGTEFSLNWFMTDGVCRYRVDGGAYVTLTGDSSNTQAFERVPDLANGPHLVELDTTVNISGHTVAIGGLYYTTTDGVGVEVDKVGNAGMDGLQLSQYVDTCVAPAVAVMKPDVAVVMPGTNDYRHSHSTPDNFIAAMQSLVTACRSERPNMGFIFVAPADSDGTPIYPLTSYRDALYQFCVDNGHEWYNMHDDWASFSIENSAGMWLSFTPRLHVSEAGAYRLANTIYRHFLTAE